MDPGFRRSDTDRGFSAPFPAGFPLDMESIAQKTKPPRPPSRLNLSLRLCVSAVPLPAVQRSFPLDMKRHGDVF